MTTRSRTLWSKYVKARRIRAFHKANPDLTHAEARYLSGALSPEELQSDQLIANNVSRPADTRNQYLPFCPRIWSQS